MVRMRVLDDIMKRFFEEKNQITPLQRIQLGGYICINRPFMIAQHQLRDIFHTLYQWPTWSIAQC
jgi:hypothetical protein